MSDIVLVLDFLRELKFLQDVGELDLSIDLVSSLFNQEIIYNRFDKINLLLSLIDVNNFCEEILINIASLTFPIKKNLLYREKFINKLSHKFKNDPELIIDLNSLR